MQEKSPAQTPEGRGDEPGPEHETVTDFQGFQLQHSQEKTGAFGEERSFLNIPIRCSHSYLQYLCSLHPKQSAFPRDHTFGSAVLTVTVLFQSHLGLLFFLFKFVHKMQEFVLSKGAFPKSKHGNINVNILMLNITNVTKDHGHSSPKHRPNETDFLSAPVHIQKTVIPRGVKTQEIIFF